MPKTYVIFPVSSGYWTNGVEEEPSTQSWINLLAVVWAWRDSIWKPVVGIEPAFIWLCLWKSFADLTKDFFFNSKCKRQLDRVNLEGLLIYFKIHIFGVKFNLKSSISTLIILNSVWKWAWLMFSSAVAARPTRKFLKASYFFFITVRMIIVEGSDLVNENTELLYSETQT